MNDRRQKQTPSEDELYKLPHKTIQNFIKNERRHDELDRLKKIRIQNAVWMRTVLICASFNGLFLLLALIGYIYG